MYNSLLLLGFFIVDDAAESARSQTMSDQVSGVESLFAQALTDRIPEEFIVANYMFVCLSVYWFVCLIVWFFFVCLVDCLFISLNKQTDQTNKQFEVALVETLDLAQLLWSLRLF